MISPPKVYDMQMRDYNKVFLHILTYFKRDRIVMASDGQYINFHREL